MSSSLANSCLGAAVLVASWSTDSVEALADLVISAVLVVLASSHRTSDLGVTLRTLWTRALSSVSHRDALGASSTDDVVGQARSHADAVSTGLVVRAVVVRFTLGLEALDLRISGQPLLAVTRWMMLDCNTLGVQTTTVVHAWVLADVIDASLFSWTFGVRSTFWMWYGV